jgi:predicted DCC family thiol-disulfide oxidoreductase YuxK
MNRAIVVFDDDCGLCQGSRRWIERRALPRAFEFVACQSRDRLTRFPLIKTEECMSSLHLICPDGRILVGAEAIPEILSRLKGWRGLQMIFRSKIFNKAADPVYRWIARNRYFLTCAWS